MGTRHLEVFKAQKYRLNSRDSTYTNIFYSFFSLLFILEKNLEYFLSAKMRRHRVSFCWMPFACPVVVLELELPGPATRPVSQSTRGAQVTSVAI